MRVAMLCEFPLDPDRARGGLEAVVRGLAPALARRPGVEVDVASFHAGLEASRTDEVDGVRVHRFPLPRRFGNVTFGRRERADTEALLRRISPDVVHALGLGPKALAAADSGLPWVASVNGVQSNEARVTGGLRNRVRAAVLRRLEDEALRRARHVIVPNAVVGGMLGPRLGGARVHAIENAVEEAFFGVLGEGDPARIVCVGRLLPLKAPEDLIDAVARLAGRGLSPEVRFVGPADDPAYLEALRERTRRAGLSDRVRFLGFVPDAELLVEISRATILAHPSHVEIAPLSVMQAVAAGRAVVATDVGGTRHLVEDGRTGLLVPAARPDALAEALASLLRAPARARALGAEAAARARRRFRLGRVVDRTLAVYREAMGGAAAPREAADLETAGSSARKSVEFQGSTPGPGRPDGDR